LAGLKGRTLITLYRIVLLTQIRAGTKKRSIAGGLGTFTRLRGTAAFQTTTYIRVRGKSAACVVRWIPPARRSAESKTPYWRKRWDGKSNPYRASSTRQVSRLPAHHHATQSRNTLEENPSGTTWGRRLQSCNTSDQNVPLIRSAPEPIHKRRILPLVAQPNVFELFARWLRKDLPISIPLLRNSWTA
jgi:hypothetical protein